MTDNADLCWMCHDFVRDCICSPTADQLIDALNDHGFEPTVHDLGSSGGGDWYAIRVGIGNGDFLLISAEGAPFDFNADDDENDVVTIVRYCGHGVYEDEGDRPTTDITGDPHGRDLAHCDFAISAIPMAISTYRSLDIDWSL